MRSTELHIPTFSSKSTAPPGLTWRQESLVLLPLERLSQQRQQSTGRHHGHLAGQRLSDGRPPPLLARAVRVRLARVEVRASPQVLGGGGGCRRGGWGILGALREMACLRSFWAMPSLIFTFQFILVLPKKLYALQSISRKKRLIRTFSIKRERIRREFVIRRQISNPETELLQNGPVNRKKVKKDSNRQ